MIFGKMVAEWFRAPNGSFPSNYGQLVDQTERKAGLAFKYKLTTSYKTCLTIEHSVFRRSTRSSDSTRSSESEVQTLLALQTLLAFQTFDHVRPCTTALLLLLTPSRATHQSRLTGSLLKVTAGHRAHAEEVQ